MLNLKKKQVEKLEACRRAASDFLSTFSREEDVEEAGHLISLEMGACAEEARELLRARRPQR